MKGGGEGERSVCAVADPAVLPSEAQPAPRSGGAGVLLLMGKEGVGGIQQ